MKDFSEMVTEDDNLVVIDSLNMAFRWKLQGTGWAGKLVSTILSISSSYNAKDTLVLGDGGSSYRKGLYADYKGNRNREDQTEAEAQEWVDFFDEYTVAMDIVAENYTILKFKGIEADDIAAYIVKKLNGKYKHIWLISSDKDWDLLVDDTVSRFSLFSKKEFTKQNWSDHYIYDRDKHIDIKVLTGDSGDNIPGISGVGPARAKQILDMYGPTALDVMDNLPVVGKAKYIQELNKFEDSFLLNYELMDLVAFCEVAIKDYRKEIDEVLNEI